MFTLRIEKEITSSSVDETKLIETIRLFSFLTTYRAQEFHADKKQLILTSGSPLSLNPNSVRHSICIDFSRLAENRLAITARARVFPWEKCKMRQILTGRFNQLASYFCDKGIISENSLGGEEKRVSPRATPFTHLPSNSVFHYITAFLRVLISMSLCITGAILIMWIYGAVIIGIKDSRLFFEVTFGTVTTKDLIGGASVIGIAIGYAVGGIMSIYLALSEIFEFLNKRILSFGIFYALLLSFFIIEEEAFIITSLLALILPFCAYTFYYLVWGLKSVYMAKANR